jgi:extradiol dioxygenase family protein
LPGDHSEPHPFDIAFPVDDLDAARTFYGTTLGCPEGRSSAPAGNAPEFKAFAENGHLFPN